MNLVRQLHSFLHAERFYSVALLSAAACSLMAARFAATGTRTFGFMLWNIALAWIPYALSFTVAAIDRLFARASGVGTVALVAAAVPWLAFSPNAPYLVTDLLHLRAHTPVPVWYDVTMFACFAISGCLLGVSSLRTMHRLCAARMGVRVAHVSGALVIVLCAFGMYLGRVVRLNSWDVATDPERVLRATWAATHNREALLFTALFSGFLFVCHVAFARGGRFRPLRAKD